MIRLILLLASSAWCQSTAPVSVPIDTQIEISNLGKDVRNILSGRPTITGIPKLQGGFCFSDGKCETASTNNTSQTMTGRTEFTGTGANGLVVSSMTYEGYQPFGPWLSFTPALSGDSSMTVSNGTVFTARYKVVGKTMKLSIYVFNIAIGGTPSSDLRITLPDSKSVSGIWVGTASVYDNGAWISGVARGFSGNGTTYIYLNKPDASNWTAGATSARFVISTDVPIQ